MDIRNGLVLLAALINFLLFVIVYFRVPRTKANLAFGMTILMIIGWCGSMAIFRAVDVSHSLLWAKFLYFFPPLIPAGFFLFGLAFPNFHVKKSIVYLVSAAALFVAALSFFPNTIISTITTNATSEKIIHFGWAYPIYILYIPISFSASFLSLYLKMKKVNALVVSQIWYFLLGLMLASLPAMITNLILPTI